MDGLCAISYICVEGANAVGRVNRIVCPVPFLMGEWGSQRLGLRIGQVNRDPVAVGIVASFHTVHTGIRSPDTAAVIGAFTVVDGGAISATASHLVNHEFKIACALLVGGGLLL